jgi:Family of unknown function (DUF6644)
MILDRFVEWLATTSGSVALHESQYLYVALESVHVLTLCLFVGLAAMLDLRLLGLTLRRVPVSKVVARLMPWTIVGFTIMIVSGALLFFAIPVRSYHSIFFRVKVLLLILAGINAWVFHAGIWLRVASWDLDEKPPRGARVAGAASLMLWMAIIFAGRLIAYNWFDCDKPQRPTVQWVSGCSLGN